jgi:hypothetical protein
MAFCRHFEKPQSTLVLNGGLRQPGKSETILPTQEEDESMSGKKIRDLSGREKSSDRTVHHHNDLSIYPLTPDRWDDFEVLFGPRGACGGGLQMWWRDTGLEGVAQLIVTSFENASENQLRQVYWPIEVRSCRLVRCRSARVSTARLSRTLAIDARLGYHLLPRGQGDRRQGLTD